MKPETVASRLVATMNRSFVQQTESLLGGLDLSEQRRGVAGPDRLEPGRLAQSDSEGQRPVVQSEIESQIEHRGVGNRRIGGVSRCHGQGPEKCRDLPPNRA